MGRDRQKEKTQKAIESLRRRWRESEAERHTHRQSQNERIRESEAGRSAERNQNTERMVASLPSPHTQPYRPWPGEGPRRPRYTRSRPFLGSLRQPPSPREPGSHMLAPDPASLTSTTAHCHSGHKAEGPLPRAHSSGKTRGHLQIYPVIPAFNWDGTGCFLV